MTNLVNSQMMDDCGGFDDFFKDCTDFGPCSVDRRWRMGGGYSQRKDAEGRIWSGYD